MIEDLFTFPTIMVDGQNEERKREELDTLGLRNDEDRELDVVYGDAEYPYFDFIGIEDRWIPNSDSFKRALKGKFDACLVKFANVGHLLVPWKKEKFKEELTKFIETREKDKDQDEQAPKKVTVIKITPEMLAGFMKTTEQQDDDGDNKD